MKIDVLTIFPGMFKGPFDESIVKRAQDKGLIDLKVHNLRDWTKDERRTVDSKPYGGGPGMVMRVDVIDRALHDLESRIKNQKSRIILMTPQGRQHKQAEAKMLSEEKHLILICGHYEGFDERIRELVDEEISIGDYVLTGGEVPAMVVIDSVVRLVPGVVGKAESVVDESFSEGVLEYPQYTRPEEYKDKKVPEILLSGNHAEIAKWRKEEAEKRTKKRRPDLAS